MCMRTSESSSERVGSNLKGRRCGEMAATDVRRLRLPLSLYEFTRRRNHAAASCLPQRRRVGKTLHQPVLLKQLWFKVNPPDKKVNDIARRTVKCALSRRSTRTLPRRKERCIWFLFVDIPEGVDQTGKELPSLESDGERFRKDRFATTR